MIIKLDKFTINIFTRPVMTPYQQSKVVNCLINLTTNPDLMEENDIKEILKDHVEVLVWHYTPNSELVEIEVLNNEKNN